MLMTASAMAKNPRLLMLDEPTSMVDLTTKEVIWRLIKEYKGTLFLVTHDLEELELVDRVVFLKKGKVLFQGRLSEFASSIRKGYVAEVRDNNGVARYEVESLGEVNAGDGFTEVRVRKVTPEDLEELFK